MEMPSNSARDWRFGVFTVDARNTELRRGGTPVKMREQSFRILLYLLEHAGQIVTRDDLRRVLWPADTYVDFDHSLNTAVMKLRDALGDSADTPLYIETIPKRGYRFIAPVSRAAETRDGATEAAAVVPSPPVGVTGPTTPQAAAAPLPDLSRDIPAPSRRISFAAGIGVLVLVGVLAFYFLRTRHPANVPREGSAAVSSEQITPVTTAPGNAIAPAFSPDGREIAFAWDGAERKHYDIYVQLIGADLPLRLTYTKSGIVGDPAWSPDGSQIAFSRCDGKNDGVYVVPALGGEERKLTSVGCLYTLAGPLAWIHGGKEMLMIDHCTNAEAYGVVLFSLVSGEKRCLTESGSPKGSDAGFGFALSPDGRTIAYINTSGSLCCDMYTIPLAGGSVRHLTVESRLPCNTLTDFGCSGLMWTPDNKSIIFVSVRTTLPSLWRVSIDGGMIERETTYPALGSFSRDGRRFVYSEKSSAEPAAVWRAELDSPAGHVRANTRIIATQYPEMDAQPSPDGSAVVWMSIRTGFEEVWKSSSSGAGPIQLTRIGGYSGSPRWSPDGRSIAFDNYTKSHSQIFVVDTEGRNLHAITDGTYDNVVPTWSRDGKVLYFSSKRTGAWQVWKRSLESGVETQLTTQGGFDACESVDRQTVYFSRFNQGGLWGMPASGGEARVVVADKPQVGYWGHWAVDKEGLYLLDADAEPRPTIEFYSFATKRITPVLTLEKQPARLQPSLSASTDGKTLYYTQYDRQSVIKMMELAQ